MPFVACAAQKMPPTMTTMIGTNPTFPARLDETLSLLQRTARMKSSGEASPNRLGDEEFTPRGRDTMLTETSGIFKIGRSMKGGDSIVIMADSFDDQSGFDVQFFDAEGTASAEFKVEPQLRRVVRNSMQNGHWMTPVISGGDDYPFHDQPSPLKIFLEWEVFGWRAFVNGVLESHLSFPRETMPPEALRVKGTLMNCHVILKEAAPEMSFGLLVSSVQTNSRSEILVPRTNGKSLEYTFPRVMMKGDSVHLIANGWSEGADWSIFFHDKIGNAAFAWSPRCNEKVVSRNAMTKGFGPNLEPIWGLEEVGGQWPFLHGTEGPVDVLFEWTWSYWATSVDGIRRPDLDFYHRTTHPISYISLSDGLKEPRISFHQASKGFGISAARPDGCDAAGELSQADKQKLAPFLASSTQGEHAGPAELPVADENISGLHHVVGKHGVLVLTLVRQPERLVRAVTALGKVGIVPVPFPATDARCASPEKLDLGIRRAHARESDKVALIRAQKAGQSTEQWWQETNVAQAIADSHRRALQAALARRDHEWTAILEDDAVPFGGTDSWDESFTKAWAAIPDGVKFVRLGWCGTGPPYEEHFTATDGGFMIGQWVDHGNFTDPHASDGGCTTGYVVHKSIIPEMLQMFPCTEAVDSCFLWKLFMSNRGSHLWGAKHMVNLDVDANKLSPHEAAIHTRRLHLKYIQAGVLQQARDVPSTRRLANS